jgi:hypothetical protein
MKTRFLLSPKYKKFGWIIFIPFAILGTIAMFNDYEVGWLDATVPAFLNKNLTLFSNGESNAGVQLFALVDNNLTNEVLGIFTLIGCVLLTFSKEKEEDEFIARLRLESLLWAVFVNSILLFLALILFYDFNFFYVMVFNLYSVFILFSVHFHWSLLRIKKEME